MSAPKPTLGYPTRTAAVVALRASGMSLQAVAARIGIPVTTVSALECSARRHSAARQSPDTSRTVHFPLALLQRLAPAARKRGMTRETLAWIIVERVVEDDLVEAVLDDAEELA